LPIEAAEKGGDEPLFPDREEKDAIPGRLVGWQGIFFVGHACIS